jgi:hypothetical protein
VGVLPPLASVKELGDFIGEPLDGQGEERRALAVLGYASTLVRSETGRDWTDQDGQLSALPDAVAQVAVAVAARAYLNPEAEYNAGIDDYTSGRKVDEAGIYLTATERRMLDAVGASDSRKTAGLGTVRVERGDLGRGDRCRWWVNGPDPDRDCDD